MRSSNLRRYLSYIVLSRSLATIWRVLLHHVSLIPFTALFLICICTFSRQQHLIDSYHRVPFGPWHDRIFFKLSSSVDDPRPDISYVPQYVGPSSLTNRCVFISLAIPVINRPYYEASNPTLSLSRVMSRLFPNLKPSFCHSRVRRGWVAHAPTCAFRLCIRRSATD
jgi:hypothetical protein